MEIKLKILSVNSLTYFIAKEIETNGAKQYEDLEEQMQETYSTSKVTPLKDEMEVGSYVCVKTNIGPPRRSPKKWVRAAVRNVFMSVGTYLYDVYLLDYGIERVVSQTDVRQLKPQYTDDFTTPFQAINFHLIDIELKNGVLNSADEKQFVEDLFKSNDYLVTAKICRQTKTNRMGHIILKDGSDLRQHYINRGWAEPLQNQANVTVDTISDQYISNTTVRKPKSSPIFKCFNSSIPKNLETQEKRLFSDKNSTASDSSISSVSSVDLSIDSDGTQLITDEEDFTLNFCTKATEPKKVQNSAKEVNKVNLSTNGVPISRREKLNKIFTQIKLKDQNGKSTNLSNECDRSSIGGTVSDIQYVLPHESKVDEDFDWPVGPKDNSRPHYEFRPAGLQPPPEVLERILTMKTQKKIASLQMWWSSSSSLFKLIIQLCW